MKIEAHKLITIRKLKVFLIAGLAILFSLGFHFLVTVTLADHDVRIGLTDLFLPMLLLVAIVDLAKKNEFPNINIKYGWYWTIVLTTWVLISFVIGVINSSILQDWVLINKVTGWFVLMCYFFCGAWISGQNEIVRRLFLKYLILVAFLIGFYSLSIDYLGEIELFLPFIEYKLRLQGFSANPNAFGILMASVFILHIPYILKNEFITPKVNFFISGVLLLCVYQTLSRSAWLGLIIAIIGLLFYRRECWKPIGISVCMCLMMNFIYVTSIPYSYQIAIDNKVQDRIISVTKSWSEKSNSAADVGVPVADSNTGNKSESKSKTTYLTNLIGDIKVKDTSKTNKKAQALKNSRLTSFNDSGINYRIDMFKRSFGYWVDSPIIGIGLGGYLWKSKLENKNPHSYIIHNSGIWLLTEMGLIGFLLFLVFFSNCFFQLVKKGQETEPLTIGMAGILLVMLGASIGTEILYQRYLWFLLGMALTVRPTEQGERL